MGITIWKPSYTVNDYSAMRWPCDEGFHIPTYNEWDTLIWVLTNNFNLSSTSTTPKTYLKMPDAWGRYYSTWDISNSGSWCYRTCSPNTSPNYNAYYVFFNNYNFNVSGASYRSQGRLIRPFKDEAAVPDSSWTKLFAPDVASHWEWVHWNSSLWLITIVYRDNAQNKYITIADKNVWATTVYNSWNTISQSNAWTCFQRWNNYGFPYGWSITTSSTQVDARNYWPWNYYSSSTFIIQYSNWSSYTNDDLWWWVTWMVQRTVSHDVQNAYIWRHIPDAYQEVEYITSSWYQRINMGITPSSSLSFEFEAAQNTSHIYENWIMWNLWSANALFFMVYNNKYRLHNWWTVVDWPTATWNKTKITIDNTGYTIDWVFYACATNNNYGTGNINLFWTPDTQYNWAYMSLYNMKVWNGLTLIRDFVPCYRKSDSVIGLYDVVNDTFYTNAWTWAFTKWPDILNKVQRIYVWSQQIWPIQ